MVSDIILVIVSAVGLYCGLHGVANKMGMAKLNNSKEYQIAAKELNKDVSLNVSIDTDPIKFNKRTKLNSCVIVEYGNKDYRYLDNLKEYGMDNLPSSIGIYVWGSKYHTNRNEVVIHKGHTSRFYIDRARLLKIDRHLYDRLVEVETLNISDMCNYNQKSIDTLRELFKRIKYTNNEQINKYIEIGRSIEYEFHM